MAEERKLRLILHIGPLGFDQRWPPRIRFADEPQNLYAETRGEGQALQFVLEDFDCSPPFLKALQDGLLLQDLQQVRWVMTVGKEPTLEDGRAMVEALNDALDEALDNE